MRTLATVLVLLLFSVPARSAPAPAPATVWHEALLDDIATDLVAGRPLVVQVHLPLCSNQILRCGNDSLGDGDAPATNLYWATSGGFVGWFGRKGSGWKQVLRARGDDPDLLEVRAWRRRVTPGAAWKRRGVDRPFDLVVVAYAWRGTAIDRTVGAYLGDLFAATRRDVVLDDGSSVAAGGAAHVVAYVGHNRFMDYAPGFDFSAYERAGAGTSRRPKGHIALACRTADYLAGADVSSAARVPLLMTADFLFAGAHAFDGAVQTFAAGGSFAAIRAGAAASYAAGEGKEFKRVAGAFTNPADRRWNAP